MHRSKYSTRRFDELSQAFHVAYEEHYTLALTGSLHRLYRTGFVLRKKVQEGSLIAMQWGAKKVYTCKRRSRNQTTYPYEKIPHGLMCTEILVRLYLSKFGVMLSDADFSNHCPRPDGGICYEDGTRLVFEFSSKDNMSRKKLMADKVRAYAKMSQNTLVLFVLDTSRERLKKFVAEHPSNIWYCDLNTFLTPAYHEQLQAPIYIWGGSGETLPIMSHG